MWQRRRGPRPAEHLLPPSSSATRQTLVPLHPEVIRTVHVNFPVRRLSRCRIFCLRAHVTTSCLSQSRTFTCAKPAHPWPVTCGSRDPAVARLLQHPTARPASYCATTSGPLSYRCWLKYLQKTAPAYITDDKQCHTLHRHVSAPPPTLRAVTPNWAVWDTFDKAVARWQTGPAGRRQPFQCDALTRRTSIFRAIEFIRKTCVPLIQCVKHHERW